MIGLNFSVVVYENLSKFNDVLSKSRCRIFYKYANRNSTYITDEFAEKLIASLKYVPVKGIYDEEAEDFTDHGNKNSEGRIYGIVPEDNNFAWEKFLDEDGVEREYACTDVLLFTSLYPEASKIVGKSQSMELYPPSIEGDWEYKEGKKVFVFKEGSFFGLQALGDKVEPCFEGAAFFTQYDALKDMIQKIEEYSLNFQSDQGGEDNMEIKFKLSDGQKHRMIFDLLNTEFNDEGNWTISHDVLDVYDDYALTYNYEKQEFERVYYTKDDETDSISLGDVQKCFYVDITEEEKQALDNLHSLNEGSYSKVDEKFTTLIADNEEKDNKISECELKIEEQEGTITTLTSEKETVEGDFTVAQETIEQLNTNLQELNQYKLGIENKEKEEVLDKYANKLSEEVINTFKEKLVDYSVNDLEKELAFELVQSNPNILSVSDYSYKPQNKTGIEKILEGYKK